MIRDLCGVCGVRPPEPGELTCATCRAEAEALECDDCQERDAEIARLRDALLRYGSHLSTCPHSIDNPYRPSLRGPCSCGFFAALGDRSPIDGT